MHTLLLDSREMHPHLVPSLIAGIAASVLFLLVLASGLGFFFLFLPTLPLMFYGMGNDARIALSGTGLASILIALAAGPAVAVLFMLGIGFPAWYICKLALLSHEATITLPGSSRNVKLVAWYPIGQIWMRLTIYACAIVSLAGLFYIGEPGGLEAVISTHIQDNFKDVYGEFREAVDMLANQWSFLIFSSTIWLWGLSLYAHSWATSRILEIRNKRIRPDMAVLPFIIPSWMLTLLAICALASLIGGPTTAFLGKTMLIALMLPYFLLGIGFMHLTSLTWPSRRIFLFFIYFFILSQFWPAFIVSGIGIYHQIKHLYFKPTSPKS